MPERMTDIKSPFTGGRVKEISTIESMQYKGVIHNVPVRYFLCVDTGGG